LLRVIIGLIFAVYGWRHLADLSGYIGAYDQAFNIPLPGLMAPLVAGTHFVGGLAVAVGVLTRYAGGALAITMVVSTLTVRLPQGLAEGRDFLGLTGFWDLDLALAGIGVALVLVGPGAYALETKLLGREI
jgi:putative oxidoreductase